MCHSLNNTWNSIVDTTLMNAIKKVKKYLGVDIPIESLRQLILSRETNTQKTTVNLLTDLVRGFIPIVLTNSLDRKIKGSNNKKSILRAIIDGIQEGFFQHIWKPRCQRWQLWQKMKKVDIKRDIQNGKKTANANNYNENAGNFLSDTRVNSGRVDMVVRGKEKVKWGLELCNDFIFNRLEKGYLGRFREWIYCKGKDNLKGIKRVIIPKCA